MAIPLQALKAAVEAGHPDHALIGVPVSLVRELLKLLPVATIAAPGVMVVIGLDLSTKGDMTAVEVRAVV